MRQGDDAWLNIVRWSLSAMIEAEEYGITSKNVDDLAKNSANPNIKRILGVTAGSGANLGLDENGPTRSSSRWAITVKASNATSARAAR